MWRNPLALLGLLTVAAPILIHILVQRRAERFPFPTLRFMAPTRLAAIRRHLLEDGILLGVRIAVLASAVVALAGPLLVTATRRHAWDQQIIRAVVTDGTGSAQVAPPAPPGRIFTGASLTDGLRRAQAWLDTAPPGRRQILIASTFLLGSLTAADIGSVRSNIGIRLERVPQAPVATRTVDGGSVFTGNGVVAQRVTLDGVRTMVGENAAANSPWPLEIDAASAARPVVEAAVSAVRAERIWTSAADRRVRLVVLDKGGPTTAPTDSARPFAARLDDTRAIRVTWMADAIDRITRDQDLQTAASRVAAGTTDVRLAGPPWHDVAIAADGRPLIAAAASPTELIIVSAADVRSVVTPLLVRSVVGSIADAPNTGDREVVSIPERTLKAWSREPGPAEPPRIDGIETDDRRWFWLLTLILLGVEGWIRGERRSAALEHSGDAARVA